MAEKPIIHIVASDANRNGKTLLARLLADYLLLDKRDPFLIDTDAPEGPLRLYFPGRTLLADFENDQGRAKAFDRILQSPGRDYVIDLPRRHMQAFFAAASELKFGEKARTLGFQIFVYFIVDSATTSLRAAKEIEQLAKADLFVAVRNDYVGSSWPEHEACLHLTALPRALAIAISDKRFSLSQFILGAHQQLPRDDVITLNRFLVDALDAINGLEIAVSLAKISRL